MLNGLSSGVEITEDGIRKLKNISIKCIYFEQQRENRLEKISIASGTCTGL